jgi:hypothetical protein
LADKTVGAYRGMGNPTLKKNNINITIDPLFEINRAEK